MASATAKTVTPKSVDDYLAAAPKDKRTTLRQLRTTIRTAAPRAVESISYGMPTYKHRGERVVYFAYWKDHYALYGIGTSLVDARVAGLKAYQQSKGTIQFPADQPLPQRLIARAVKARLAEIARTG
jgi:uncharacterized protein YdhG (YjbR/CyaY superfamily)